MLTPLQAVDVRATVLIAPAQNVEVVAVVQDVPADETRPPAELVTVGVMDAWSHGEIRRALEYLLLQTRVLSSFPEPGAVQHAIV